MKVLKKEENFWKKNQGIKQGVNQGVNQIRNVSNGMKRSLRASNIGEAEQEEQEANNSSQGGSVSFSSLEKNFSNGNQRSVPSAQSMQKNSVAPKQRNVQSSQTSTSYPYHENFLQNIVNENHAPYSEKQKKQNRSRYQNGSRHQSSNSPYGWGSTTGKNQWSAWESAKAGASPEMTGTSHFVSGQAVGGTASGAAGSTAASAGVTATGATGSAASGAATGVVSGAAGGVVGVAVSGTVSVLQKGKEYIEDALQRSRQVRQEQKNQSGNESSGTITAFFGMAVMSIIIISVLVCSIAAMLYSISARGQSIVEVAQAELEVWEDNIGGEKYKDWYGIDGNWCAIFVSWCSDQCGYIEDGIMPKTASVRTMSEWYKEREQYQSKSSGYEPKAGDIVFFQENGSHTGIVIDYDSATRTVTTIEGNTGSSSTTPYHEGSRVKEKSYPLTHYKISGYGLPDYPFESNEPPTEIMEEVALLPKKM